MPSPHAESSYTAVAVPSDQGLADVRLELEDKVWRLAGRGGPAAEAERALAAVAGGGMPVFIGAGLGTGLAAVRRAWTGPIFILDREEAIEAVTGVRAAWAGDASVHFLGAADPDMAAATVTEAARAAGFSRLALVLHPVYPRLRPAWYGPALARLKGYAALRERLTARRFAGAETRVLLLWRPYFLYREIEAALARLDVACRRVDTGTGERGETGVVEAIVAAVADFRPDFALTVNHLGLDREGRLAGLFADIDLPLASWFVDSPRLILHDYQGLATPLTMLFSYDADSLAELAAMGYGRTAWLPLATDPERFRPAARLPAGHPWRADVSFVGASMERQAAEELAKLPAGAALTGLLAEAALAFAASPEPSARRFFEATPAYALAYAALPGAQARLHAELALTWEATRRYRQDCVRALLPFSPLLVGDADWERALPGAGTIWRRLASLDYYTQLPEFYPQSDIGFNCTSLQMKGAVNQRVFDVPGSGGFLLTDAREQLDALFTPGRETAVYQCIAEIPDLIRHYLAHPEERRRISQAARTRILAQHTYVHRLDSLCAAMKAAFGTGGSPPGGAGQP
jgi:spore maturation protein CgeB